MVKKKNKPDIYKTYKDVIEMVNELHKKEERKKKLRKLVEKE